MREAWRALVLVFVFAVLLDTKAVEGEQSWLFRGAKAVTKELRLERTLAGTPACELVQLGQELHSPLAAARPR